MYEIIKSRFGKAIRHYDSHAVAQKLIADKLFDLIGRVQKAENVLEIGCGTGNLSRRLLELSPGKLILNDICPGYAGILREKLACPVSTDPEDSAGGILFSCGNAQEITGKQFPVKFNLIASASAIQWLPDPLQFMIDCRALLAEDGLLAVSTFAPDNMQEVTSSSGYGLQYPPPEVIKSMLAKHYRLLHLSTGEITLTFPNPVDVLKHLKLTGVNGVNSTGWTKKDLKAFQERYETVRNPDGSYPLTYRPVFILCKQK